MTEQKGLRYNEGKVKWGLVHFESLIPMVRVLEFGASKYAPFNWQKGLNRMEILESMQRHLASMIEYEQDVINGKQSEKDIDEESGICHMGHILCNGMFYNYFRNKEKQESVSTDDLPY